MLPNLQIARLKGLVIILRKVLKTETKRKYRLIKNNGKK